MYHVVVIDKQFLHEDFPNKYNIFAQKNSGDWTIYGLGVDNGDINSVILNIQKNTKEGTWYAHAYSENELIIIFKEEVFKISPIDPNGSSWQEAVEFGTKLSIPSDQLNFFPYSFSQEAEFFSKT